MTLEQLTKDIKARPQAKLADASGLNVSTLYRIANEPGYMPTMRTVKAIIEACKKIKPRGKR